MGLVVLGPAMRKSMRNNSTGDAEFACWGCETNWKTFNGECEDSRSSFNGHPGKHRQKRARTKERFTQFIVAIYFWTMSSSFASFGCEFHTIRQQHQRSQLSFHFLWFAPVQLASFVFFALILFVSSLSFYFILRALNIYCIFKYLQQNEWHETPPTMAAKKKVRIRCPGRCRWMRSGRPASLCCYWR